MGSVLCEFVPSSIPVGQTVVNLPNLHLVEVWKKLIGYFWSKNHNHSKFSALHYAKSHLHSLELKLLN